MRQVIVAILSSWLWACGGGGGGGDGDDDVPPPTVAVKVFAANFNRNLDLLYVVDNSGSMGEEQNSLAANFPLFMNVLSTIEGGLPNVHIGVVSSNVGTDGVNILGCSSAARPQGDDGNLLTNGCSGMDAAFLSDVAQPDGSRLRNFTGELPSAFSCVARLGTNGCGFEQHLESMYRALQPGKNPGFLRDDARLAVIVIGDEDDCSALPGGELFGDPTAALDSPLGPRTSFRCHEFGVQCDDDPTPRAFGTRTGCVPRRASPYNVEVSKYVEYLRGLKAHVDDVVVSGIIGNVDAARTAVVGPDPDDATRPALSPSCSSGFGAAYPGFRLQSFLEGFPDRYHVTSICNDDLSDAMVGLANSLKQTLGIPCLGLDLADGDAAQPGLQPTCTVTEFQEHGVQRSDVVPVPPCSEAAAPCWRIVADAQVCPATAGNLILQIDRGAAVAAPDAFVQASCVVN